MEGGGKLEEIPWEATGRVKDYNNTRADRTLEAVPCSSTAAGIFMLQLHWCNKGLWSPGPDPELGTQDWVTLALPLQRLINRVECMYKHKRKSYTISITLKCEVCCGAPDEGDISSTWGKIKPEKPLQRGLSDAGDGWSPGGEGESDWSRT